MRRFTVANHSCLMIKYAKDDRYSDEGVATHDRQISSAMLATSLKQAKKEAFKHGVIGIDEGQFVSHTHTHPVLLVQLSPLCFVRYLYTFTVIPTAYPVNLKVSRTITISCVCYLQFPDIVEFCEEMANAGKTVIVAALDGTFQRKVCSCCVLSLSHPQHIYFHLYTHPYSHLVLFLILFLLLRVL